MKQNVSVRKNSQQNRLESKFVKCTYFKTTINYSLQQQLILNLYYVFDSVTVTCHQKFK